MMLSSKFFTRSRCEYLQIKAEMLISCRVGVRVRVQEIEGYVSVHFKWLAALQTPQINLSLQLSTANSALFQRTQPGSQQPPQPMDGCLLSEIA